MADLVLWEPAFFGTKPQLVIKGGLINWANMGDTNASLTTPQPKIMRPMYGAFGEALFNSRISFVSRASAEAGIKEKYGLKSIVYPVHDVRQLTKESMLRNTATPNIEVNPETFEVTVDGYPATVPPAKELALAQLYWFS